MTTVQVSHDEQLILDTIRLADQQITVNEIARSCKLDGNVVHELLNQGGGLWERNFVQRFNDQGIHRWAIFRNPLGKKKETRAPAEPRAPMEPVSPEPSLEDKEVPPVDSAEARRLRKAEYHKKYYADHREEQCSKGRERYNQKTAAAKSSKAPPKAVDIGLAAQVAEELSREIHQEALKEAERIIAEALAIVRHRSASK